MVSELTDSSPKVSVIIPLYNKAAFIERAIDSILSQTVQDFEIVVVNDGSTDGGEIIVNAYTDSRIRLINQENSGVSVARNNGVYASRAEFVAFLDADDEWLPDFLDTVLRLRRKWPDAGLYGTNRIIVNTSPKYKETLVLCHQRYDEGIYPYFKMSALGAHPFCMSSVAIPKSVLMDVGLFRTNIKYYEDMEIYARIGLSYKIVCSPLHLVRYYKEDEYAATSTLSLIPEIHPIIQLVNELKERDELDSRWNGCSDLNLYLDSLNLCQATNRMLLNRQSARPYILRVTHKELFWRKWMLYLYSFIPEFILPALRDAYGYIRSFVSDK